VEAQSPRSRRKWEVPHPTASQAAEWTTLDVISSSTPQKRQRLRVIDMVVVINVINKVGALIDVFIMFLLLFELLFLLL
jgi:hypothetical protein